MAYFRQDKAEYYVSATYGQTVSTKSLRPDTRVGEDAPKA